MSAQDNRRDTVVIGASAGGIDALPRLIGQLPAELGAAVLVVQHLAVSGQPMLAGIIARHAHLPVVWAEQGDRIETGRVFVTPPGTHMMIVDDHLQLSAGPREDHVRPSINRLFHSAAERRGPRCVGILLTGTMGDGVAGLRAIRDAGGATIVQDPRDAAYPELPARALHAFDPDRVLPLDAIGSALLGMLGEQIVEPVSEDRRAPSVVSCPSCGGVMWEIGDEHLRRYRCPLGHVATAQEVLARGSDRIASAIGGAIRALHDRVSTYETLANDAHRTGDQATYETYARKATEARVHADLARKLMADVRAA